MKTLFITGGNGDIGRAISDKFSHAGYEVIAPGSALLNLVSLDDVDDFISTLPAVDAFIHCAGINQPKPFTEIEFIDLEKTLTINAFAFYKIIQTLIKERKLCEGGHVLAISSIYGEVSRKGRFSYTAAKSCLNGMVKNCALELGPQRIKVNGLSPGFVDTSLTRKNNSQEVIDNLINCIPLRHLARVEDIAKIAYFLATEENAYINGQIIIADGGYLTGGFQE